MSPTRSADEPDLEELERLLGHEFEDRDLLLAAVTHRSFAHENPGEGPDNESLEFLGDAVLAFVIADRLYSRFPGLDEGRLSKHKSMVEKATALASAARLLDLGRFLRLGRGERRSGGRRNDKILANAFEAVVAAVYCDGGLRPVRRLVERSLGPRIESLDPENPISDYKSALQELTQSQGLGTPTYETCDELGEDHAKRFVVQVVISGESAGRGEGYTKRSAHQVAARRALQALRGRAEGSDADP